MLSLLRFIAAFIGWIFGFLLGVALLEVSRTNEVDNRVIVGLLLATACGILGFLGVEYVTVRPARWLIRRIRDSSAADPVAGVLKKDDGIAFLRELRHGRARMSREEFLLDTSVIIDGRIADVARAGF